MERFSMIEHLHDKPESVIKLVRCEFDRFLKWTDRRSGITTLYDDFARWPYTLVQGCRPGHVRCDRFLRQ